MRPKVMPKEELGEQLNAWNRALLKQDLDRADDIHKNIAHLCTSTDDNDPYHLLYMLLEVRSHLKKEQFSLAKASLSNVYPHLLDEPALFYYHFFRGMIETSEKNYQEALSHYKSAEEYLKYIDDDVEKAEFFYQYASIFYFLVRTWESTSYLQKAKLYYENIEGFEKRKASCSVGLGLNLIDIKQYEQAEVELLNALDFANKTDDIKLKINVYHNLGLFYADQNHSSIAIRYLKETLNLSKNIGNPSILFLLAQEYCKIGNIDAALPYYEEGVSLSNEKDDEEYRIKFQILHDLYLQDDPSIKESSLKKGINHFKDLNLWASVQWYSEILANLYYIERKYKKASDYYALYVESNHKLNEMGALK